MGSESAPLTALTPSTLPNATTSVVYSQLLTEPGGGAPYTWSIASGTLPTGLSLATSSTNNTTTISGTPTSAGTANFTIQVQSSDGSTSTQAYALTVISGTHLISGTVLYYDGVTPVSTASSSITMSLLNSSSTIIATTTTNASGSYQFSGVPDGGSYTIQATSTDNSTNAVSSADQIKIGRNNVGLEPFSTTSKSIAGDVNWDGSLTSGDQIKIGRFLTGLDTSFISGGWVFYPSTASVTSSTYRSTPMTISLPNLTNDTTTQNFVGIKMGDVTAVW